MLVVSCCWVGCRWLSFVVVGCCWLLLDAVSWHDLLPVVVEEGLR